MDPESCQSDDLRATRVHDVDDRGGAASAYGTGAVAGSTSTWIREIAAVKLLQRPMPLR